MNDFGPAIGQPVDRVDGRLKVTGGARYSAEVPVANVAHGVLITSAIAAGSIQAMHTDFAAALPGVIAVITPFNAMALSHPPAGNGAGSRNPVTNLSLLQDTDIYYANQPIGIVVAETLEQAQHAARIVRVDYAAARPKIDWKNEKRHAYAPARIMGGPPDYRRGDFDRGSSSAPVHVSQTYSTPYENHNPMEPHATIALWDGSSLTLYDSTQGIFGVKQTLAHVFGLPPDNVRVVCHFLGGGFGCKGSVWSHVPLAAMAAKQVERPVKLVVSRSQMFGPVGFRPRTEQVISLAASTGGALAAVKHDVTSETSVFGEFVEPSAAATRMLYATDNCATSQRLVRLNTGTPTFMRAPGESSGTYAIEAAMDELAYSLGMDPLKLRLANYAEKDPESGKPWSEKSLLMCYLQGAERFGWSRRSVAPRSMHTSDGLLLGWGLATATYPARRSPSSALARVLADGTGYAAAGSQDLGTGTYTIMTQIAADAIGLPVSVVRFDLGDTRLPATPGSGGSQTAASTGSAVFEAGMAVRAKAIAAAVADKQSPLFGLSPDAVGVSAGRMFAKTNPLLAETYGNLLTRQGLPSLEALVTSRPDQEAAQDYSAHSFGAVFVEVSVDPDFGRVQVKRVVGAYDIGRALNAKTATSQLMGGIVWGIGMALLEETVYDPHYARVVNADLAEYLVPVNADVPPIEVVFIEDPDFNFDPLGARGIGEIGITGVVAAIANAVYHATGKRVRDLPITLDKVV